MSFKTLLASLLIVLVFCAMTNAQTLVSEPFDYPVTISGLGDASNGFGGPWAADTAAHGKEGLATLASNVFRYDDLNWAIPDAGNHVQVTHMAPWADAQRYLRPLAETWPNEAGKTYWLSYLLDVKEPLPVGSTYFMVKLYNGTNEIIALGKGGGREDAPVFTCGSGWPGNAGDDVSDVEIVGGPVWLVMKMVMTGSDAPARTFMWVDPDPSAEPDTSTAAVARNTSVTNGFNTIALEYGGDGSGQQLIFDEIRIASSYGDLSIVTDVKTPDSSVPEKFNLAQNYPNPFNPETNITFSLTQPEQITLSIFNITGQKVRDLILNEQRNSGSHVIRWNGKDNFGKPVASGVYIYRLQTASKALSQKMLLLK